MLDLLHASTQSFMQQLSPRVGQKVEASGVMLKYDNGQWVHNRGEVKPGISIVKSGAVNVGIYGEDGTFIMTSKLGVGHTFGEFTLFTGLPRTHDVSASGPTRILQISAARFLALYESEPEISRALLSASLSRLHISLEILDALRRLPMRERTAKVLVAMMKSAPDKHVFEYRQSDLAFTLGVSRVSLSKALNALKALGLIETGYGHISLPDPTALSVWVRQNCDNYDLS